MLIKGTLRSIGGGAKIVVPFKDEHPIPDYDGIIRMKFYENDEGGYFIRKKTYFNPHKDPNYLRASNMIDGFSNRSETESSNKTALQF